MVDFPKTKIALRKKYKNGGQKSKRYLALALKLWPFHFCMSLVTHISQKPFNDLEIKIRELLSSDFLIKWKTNVEHFFQLFCDTIAKISADTLRLNKKKQTHGWKALILCEFTSMEPHSTWGLIWKTYQHNH